jgi:hypothetical protein
MLSHNAIPLILSLAATCYSQTTTRRPFAELALGTPSTTSPNDCDGIFTKDQPALAIRFYWDFIPDVCYDLANMYSNDTLTSLEPKAVDEGFVVDTCDPLRAEENCTGFDYVVQSFNHYSPPMANLSLSRFTIYQPENTAYESDIAGATLKVFPGSACDDAEPWFSWGGCEEEQEYYCRDLPYSVGSLRLERTAEEDVGECILAAERGAGKRVEMSSMAVVVGMVVAGFMIAV